MKTTCPACGAILERDPLKGMLEPKEKPFKCDVCDTQFVISVEFLEVTE